MARDVSSFLVPHQSSEDLVQRGIPAPEARQRSFFRTSLMERLSTLIQVILTWAILVPAIIPLLLSVSLLFGLVIDVIYQGTTASIVLFLFGHIGDACNQPLGLCVLTFWISVASKLSLILLWSGCEGFLTECCDGLTFRNLSACLSGSFAIFTVLFEVIWPVTIFIMLLLADSCTPGLIASTWFLLSPFFLEALCCWPILSSCHPKVDPVDLMDTFTRIGFDPDTFNDETYATGCVICLSDFAASHDIVLAPCAAGRHVFHEQCLLGWLQRAQTCPLCRSRLSAAASRGEAMELPLAS